MGEPTGTRDPDRFSAGLAGFGKGLGPETRG